MWIRLSGGGAAVALLLMAGCALGGGPGIGGGLTWDAGLATSRDVMEKSVRVLRNNQYDMEREDGPPNIYLLTRWRQRAPLGDEAEMGAEMAQTRFIVEARPRQRSPETTDDVYTVRVRVQNELRMEGETDWVEADPTDEFRAYASHIAALIREELEVGIRIWDD